MRKKSLTEKRRVYESPVRVIDSGMVSVCFLSLFVDFRPVSSDQKTGRKRFSLSQGESLAEIDAPHLEVVSKFTGRSSAKDTSLCNDIGPIGDAERLSHVVIGN
jgi:hypothetical protein